MRDTLSIILVDNFLDKLTLILEIVVDASFNLAGLSKYLVQAQYSLFLLLSKISCDCTIFLDIVIVVKVVSGQSFFVR